MRWGRSWAGERGWPTGLWGWERGTGGFLESVLLQEGRSPRHWGQVALSPHCDSDLLCAFPLGQSRIECSEHLPEFLPCGVSAAVVAVSVGLSFCLTLSQGRGWVFGHVCRRSLLAGPTSLPTV